MAISACLAILRLPGVCSLGPEKGLSSEEPAVGSISGI